MSKECENNCHDCEHDCSNCDKSNNCNHKKIEKLLPNSNSDIKKIIGVVSGKGGVGKSLACSLLASKLNKQGLKVGIIDADVTGPSIPKVLGVTGQLTATEDAMNPAQAENGIKIISSNLLLDNPDSPVAWRGPVVSGAISQFFNMTNWGDIDVMLIDMPPGTSDVFLTVMQTLPVDGIVCVSTPQDLVEMIVGKAINLANMMNIEVLSLIENMSYFKCDKCGKKHEIFGQSKAVDVAKKYNIDSIDKLPMDPILTQLCDNGQIIKYDTDNYLNNTINKINKL